MDFDSIKSKFKKKEKVPETTVGEESLSYEELINTEQSYDHYDVPSDAKQLWSIIRLEFKHFLKTKSFFVLFILAAIVPFLQMTGLLDIVGKLASFMVYIGGTQGDISSNVYMHHCLCLVPFVMLMCMVFFCGRTISNEYANRTAFLNMPLPMKRWIIFTGKFIAISLISFSIVLFAYGMSFLATSFKYSEIILVPVFQSLLISFFSMLALVATGMLFSAFMKQRGGAMAFLLLFVAIPMLIPILISVLETVLHNDISMEFLKYTLPFVMDDAILVLSFEPLLSVPSILTVVTPIGVPDVWALILLAIVWGAAFFAGGLYLFNKKEV